MAEAKLVDLVHPDLDGRVITASEGRARVLAKSGWRPADTTADEQDPTPPTPRRGRQRAAEPESQED